MKKQRKLISFENNEEPSYDIFEQYYLGFRSAMFICEDTITNLQLIFIFAHEYAHILLNHFDDSRDNFVEENEADSFALKIVLDYVEKDNSYSKHDVLAAIRWLFKYQLIEESMGALSQGKTIKYFESNFEKRRSKFQAELFDDSELTGSTLFESVGFCTIVELQSILYESGLELVNDMIEIFHKSKEAAGKSLSFDGGLTAEILLSFSVGVASGVVGNFIFASLCNGVKKLTLNNRRTRIT